VSLNTVPYLGELAALLTAVLWSGSSLVFAAASRRVGSVLVNVSRLVFALLYMLALLPLVFADIHLNSRQVMYFAISGIIGLALGDSFLFRAYQQIGARVSMLVMSIAPAISALLAFVFLGEAISIRGVAGMSVTIAGIALVVLSRKGAASAGSSLTAGGITSAFFAAVGQGVSLVFAKLAFASGPVNGFVAAGLRIAVAVAVLLPIVFATGRLTRPVETFARDRRALTLTAVGSILGPFLGISFSLIAVAHTNVGVAATLMATVPIIMLPILRFVYREVLSWEAFAGAFIAVAGVAILFLR
jgi:drug/metabolite transporter (DMT)-like permease